jgi:hypothetical protein
MVNLVQALEWGTPVATHKAFFGFVTGGLRNVTMMAELGSVGDHAPSLKE